MSDTPPQEPSPPTGPEKPQSVPALREVLTGAMALRYGPLPIVALPQDDEVLTSFIRACAEILADKGIYRRDTIVVVPYAEKRRLMLMEAKAFCSWMLHHLMPSKTKYDKQGDPFPVFKDVPTEVAEKVLVSQDFWQHLPEIEVINPAPMPVLRKDGTLALLTEGYDAKTGTLTFGLK